MADARATAAAAKAAIQADATPEAIYHRLSAAYAANRLGFGGSTEENALWGDVSKHALLAWLHRWLQPALYLEIGVDQGVSLACTSRSHPALPQRRHHRPAADRRP